MDIGDSVADVRPREVRVRAEAVIHEPAIVELEHDKAVPLHVRIAVAIEVVLHILREGRDLFLGEDLIEALVERPDRCPRGDEVHCKHANAFDRAGTHGRSDEHHDTCLQLFSIFEREKK